MRFFPTVAAACVGLILAGCGDSSSSKPAAGPAAPAAGSSTGSPSSDSPHGDAKPGPAAGGPAPSTLPGTSIQLDIVDGAVALSPASTEIQFVGTHAPPKPLAPRTGFFSKFTGKINVDKESKKLTGVSVEIETGSLLTFDPKLTNHLQSGDFLDAREYPTIRFESTDVSSSEDDMKITGNLTLHGTTKEVTFAGKASVEQGLALTARLTIDRSEFGMDKMLEGVNKEVEISVAVGKKTMPPQPAGPPGGGGAKASASEK